MRGHSLRLAWSLVCGSVVLAAVAGILAFSQISLAGKPNKPPKDTSNRVHYFAWYDLDPLGAFGPNGPCPLPGSHAPPYDPYDTVVGGLITDADNPQMTITAAKINLSNINPGVYPSGLALDDDVIASQRADLATCFPPSVEPYRGGHLIRTDGKVQMNLTGLSMSGGKNKWYNLVIDVDRVVLGVDTDGEEMLAPVGWTPLDLAPGATASVYLGTWELKAGTGPIAKGCHASGDLSDEGTAITIRRFTQGEEDLQRDLN